MEEICGWKEAYQSAGLERKKLGSVNVDWRDLCCAWGWLFTLRLNCFKMRLAVAGGNPLETPLIGHRALCYYLAAPSLSPFRPRCLAYEDEFLLFFRVP